jgi:hypothetical protein
MMASNFGSRVFTPVVKELQERYGSRRQLSVVIVILEGSN